MILSSVYPATPSITRPAMMKPVVLSTIGSDGEGTAMSWCSDEIVLGIHYLLDDKLR